MGLNLKEGFNTIGRYVVNTAGRSAGLDAASNVDSTNAEYGIGAGDDDLRKGLIAFLFALEVLAPTVAREVISTSTNPDESLGLARMSVGLGSTIIAESFTNAGLVVFAANNMNWSEALMSKYALNVGMNVAYDTVRNGVSAVRERFVRRGLNPGG